MKSPPALVLASTSAYRRALLARVHRSFRCRAPGVDETRRRDEPAAALVRRLALAKARAVAAHEPDAWIIGSDQVAALGDTVLGKPGTPELCAEQLRRSSGRPVDFLTAVALVRQGEDAAFEFIDTTRVTFRVLDEATIERYVARESPLDCAGGFKSEGLGISLCESIDTTDPTALIGLPMIRLCAVLREAGFELP